MTEARKMNAGIKKKKKGKAFRIILPLILILIIIGTLVVAVLYNLFSFRDILFDTVYSLDPEYRAVESIKAGLDLREQELDKKEERILKSEQRLNGLEEKLNERDKELDRREIENIPIYLRPMTDEDLESMKSISRVYSEMAPEDAAEILASLYSVEDMTAILYYMSEKKSAEILAVIDRGLAVEITDMLIHY